MTRYLVIWILLGVVQIASGSTEHELDSSHAALRIQRRLRHSSHGNIRGEYRPVELKPSACVSILIYQDNDCLEGPVRSMTFPTYTEPGSPCYHDDSMQGYSVKDQYCDLSQGTWHETDYLGSEDCQVKWYELFSSPKQLVLSQGTCVDGFKLDYCMKGSCSDQHAHEVMTGVPNSWEHPVATF